MLLQFGEFKINEFRIPKFSLNKGEMIRFWVQIIPKHENDSNGYWGTKKMQETVRTLNSQSISIRICPNQIKRDFFD